MIYPVSVFISLFLLLPLLADRMDWNIPFMGILNIPATGLEYMGTFFHELGHTAIYWIFGYPALPSFDFQNGGGLTYGLEQPEHALAGIYILIACGAAYLGSKRQFLLLGILVAFTVVHLAIAFNPGHEVLMLFMGHGAEIIIGSFCVLRGIIGHEEYGSAERWINLVFGLYTIFQNLLMSYGLMFDDIMRIVYEEQKGGHGLGDYSRIADILDIKVEGVAAFATIFAFAFLALAVFIGVREKRFL